jgi:hypothetical protein
MTATIHALIPTAKLRCEGCGTLADAACGCGVGYLPVKASDAAAKAIAADRQASNVAIAEKIGVTEATVRRAWPKPASSCWYRIASKRAGSSATRRFG